MTRAQSGVRVRPKRARRLLGVCSGLLIGAIALPVQHPAARTSQPPNVVFLISDDQRWDMLWAMPNVQADLVDHGVTFTNGFVVNPLCCPSRASILTGEYSHSTDVYKNSLPHGGFFSFDDSSTVATWLQSANYTTGLVGKYLNQYNGAPTYIPPGWNHWDAIDSAQSGGAYYDYTLNDDGQQIYHGYKPEDYSTTVLADDAQSFIRTADPAKPVFLYFAPYAPHLPATPAPGDEGSFSNLDPYRPPNYDEQDVSDKPGWVQKLPLLSDFRVRQIDQRHVSMYQSLLELDRGVHDIVTALSDTGRLSNTLIVFMSDNGWSWGEHRWQGKQAPYEEDIRVPFVVRYDPLVPSARTDDHLVLNIDLAPTAADAAGVPAPGAAGSSVVPLLQTPTVSWRRDLLVEHYLEDIPTCCEDREITPNDSYAYVEYAGGSKELYDLLADPWQLDNKAYDPGYASIVDRLAGRLAELCNPRPPGWPGTQCTITGTDGNDTLVGTDGPDYICGLGGDDTIIGEAGDDTIDGGTGNDTVSYEDSNNKVTVDLSTGRATGQGRDSLVSNVDVIGSNFKATPQEDAGDNPLAGLGGNDSLTGGDGDDTLRGGPGNDSLDGGAGTDVCEQDQGTGTVINCES